jgi:hypothetical protein
MLWAFVPSQEALHHVTSSGRRRACVIVLTRGATARPRRVEAACADRSKYRSANERVPRVLRRFDARRSARTPAGAIAVNPAREPTGVFFPPSLAAAPRPRAFARPVFAPEAARIEPRGPHTDAIGSR